MTVFLVLLGTALVLIAMAILALAIFVLGDLISALVYVGGFVISGVILLAVIVAIIYGIWYLINWLRGPRV